MPRMTRFAILSALVVVLSFHGSALAQNAELTKLNILIAADSNDPDIAGELDAKTIQGIFNGRVPKNRLQIDVIKGDQLNARAILAHYENYGPRKLKNEALMFYYSGHGLMISAGDNLEHYLKLSTKERVARKDIHTAMQKLEPGLLILLTDCCSGLAKGNHPPPRHNTYSDGLPPGFRQLFFRTRGLVDITGAEDGTSSWGDFVKGGAFTKAFEQTLFDIQDDANVSWLSYYDSLKGETALWAKRIKAGKPQSSRAFVLPGASWGFTVSATASGDQFRISEVRHGGAAERAGVKSGDSVLRVNNHDTKTYAAFNEAMSTAKDGPEIRMLMSSNGKQVERVLQK